MLCGLCRLQKTYSSNSLVVTLVSHPAHLFWLISRLATQPPPPAHVSTTMMLNVVSLLILVLPLTHGAMTVHTFGSSDAAVGKLAAAYEKSATVIFGPILSHPDAVSDVYIYDAAREATDKATWVTAICNNKMHNSGQDPNCARLYNDRPSMQTIAAAGACGPPGTADLSKCAGMVMHAGLTSGASSNLAESLVIPQQTFDLPPPLEGEGCCADGGEKVAIHESWHLVSSYITTSYTTRGGFAGGNPESGTAQPYFGPYWLEEGIAEYVALTRAALIPGYGYNLAQTLAHSFTARRQQLLAHPECRLAGMRFLGEASWDGQCRAPRGPLHGGGSQIFFILTCAQY